MVIRYCHDSSNAFVKRKASDAPQGLFEAFLFLAAATMTWSSKLKKD